MHPISPWTIHQFLTSLGFTIVLETSLLYFVLKKATSHAHLTRGRIIFAGIFVNAATVPYVWFIFPYLFNWQLNSSLVVSEPFVAIVEAIFYRAFLKTSWKTAFAASVACNIASFFIGPYLRAHGLWLYW